MSLKQLYPTLSQTDNADDVVTYVDIIAVHGLNPRSSSTHAADTWEKQGHSWLKEALPKHTPNARIWIYSYNSTVVYGKDKSSFIQKADEFLERVRVKRIQDPERPLVLIGHSLGGLLIEQALVNAHNNPKYTHIKNATTGLAFFATPHNGGNPKLLTLGNVTSKIARSAGLEQSKDVLETLKDDSIFTGILQEHWRQQILKYQIVSFWGSEDSIVSDKSAKFGTLPGDVENVVKLKGGHSDICRFSPKDEVDVDNLELVVCNIKDLYDIALRESAVAFGTHILQILAFERMTTKYQSVVRPHENTFDWIFESNEISRPLDKCLSNIPQKSDDSENKRFREWLRTNSFEGWMRSKTTKNVNGNINNLYWIVGKAGSGKSTLMKHIFKHPKTEQRLSHWKGTNQLLQVGYFFERGHSSEERLLRTLLHQILIYDESIIVSVYKELWEQFSKFKGIRGKRPDRPAESISDVRTSRFKEEGIESAVLDVDSLFDALSRAAGLICASTKLFFLIDGLDEIVGVGEDSEEDQMTAYEKCQSLSKMIAKMAENENIKMCVSSRPHLGFEDEEGGLSEHPRLELEKATGPDITHYVDSQLGQNTRFAHMARDDPQSAKELCQDIKDKASGMFLWVSLVVKILIDGVNHRSRMHDLKRKLQLLPKEMTGENGLYMQMLKSVGHGQLEERGRIVLILIQSFRMGIPLSPLLLDFAEEEGEIEDLIHEKNSKKFDAKRSLQRVKDRLKGCCGGIFEVKSIAPPSNGTEQDIFTDLTVDAIHGTVWEFLGEPVALVEWMWYPREECVPDSLTSLIRSAILCLHFMPPTTTENCKELAKVCIDLVMEATVSIENHSWCSSEIHEEQDALCQTGRDSIRTVSKLISVFDQVGSKALEKTRRYFESSEKHWIYLMDTKVFDYYDDYESYMVSSLLNVGSVFCVEHLLFDDQYKKVYNRNKSPISHALSCYLNLWGPEFESLAGTLRSIICRLAREKQHYIIITSIFEERGKRYKSYWIQLLSERPSDDEPSACKIRYLETLELLIENVPNLLETPLGKARNVADVLEHFGDVAEKRDEVLERIKPTLKQQESLCTLM